MSIGADEVPLLRHTADRITMTTTAFANDATVLAFVVDENPYTPLASPVQGTMNISDYFIQATDAELAQTRTGDVSWLLHKAITEGRLTPGQNFKFIWADVWRLLRFHKR